MRAAQTGAPYWSRIALAEVVSLFAVINVIIHREKTKPLTRKVIGELLVFFGGGAISLKTSKKRTATRLLKDEITKGCQSTSLMVKPAVLHKNAVAKSDSCPANLGSFESKKLMMIYNREIPEIKEVQLKLQF